MKKFLDRIKDQTKNFVEEVKEKNKGNRTELMLMGGFVLAFLALSVPEAVKEASSGQVQTDGGQEESAEAVAGESSHGDDSDARPGMPMANQKMQKMMILARKTALMKTADQMVKETI